MKQISKNQLFSFTLSLSIVAIFLIGLPQTAFGQPSCNPSSDKYVCNLPPAFRVYICSNVGSPRVCLCSTDGVTLNSLRLCGMTSGGYGYNEPSESQNHLEQQLADSPFGVFLNPYVGNSSSYAVHSGQFPLKLNEKEATRKAAIESLKQQSLAVGATANEKYAPTSTNAFTLEEEDAQNSPEWVFRESTDSEGNHHLYIQPANDKTLYLRWEKEAGLSLVRKTADMTDTALEELLWHVGAVPNPEDRVAQENTYRISPVASTFFALVVNKNTGVVSVEQIYELNKEADEVTGSLPIYEVFHDYDMDWTLGD